jgi:23S rRNA (uracil1939-C5)-methyltransferase
VSPEGFFQSNWKLNLSLVDIIKSSLQPLKDKKILDLYAGAGNFSLPLAKDARVIAVEENRAAIKDGTRNLKINKIRNCKFIRSSSENFQVKDHIDIVIIDPPRMGLTKKAMGNVLSVLPESIVYISCNPATFARDLKILLSKYEVESLRMIDFFPQTYHIETLAFLKKTV